MADSTLSASADRGDAAFVPHRRVRDRRGREDGRMGLNLTAMIDVVFLLLIYFMVATDFRMGEEIYRMDIPPRQPAAATADPFELDEQPLRIAVATTGLHVNDYQLRIDGPYRQPSSFRELEEFLASRQIHAGTSSGLFLPDHPIIIEPLANARWEHAMAVFNAAVRNDYTNIIFARPK